MRWLIRFLNNRRGFSLIDVMIGMVVLAIALGGAFQLTITTSRLMERNHKVSIAATLAEFKLEELRNAEFAGIASGADGGTIDSAGNAGGIFTRSWNVVNNAPVADLKTVTVTVSWNQWGEVLSYALTGVVGQ